MHPQNINLTSHLLKGINCCDLYLNVYVVISPAIPIVRIIIFLKQHLKCLKARRTCFLLFNIKALNNDYNFVMCKKKLLKSFW